MEANVNSYKLWWARLNSEIIRGYGRIADRNMKQDVGDKMINAMQISDMHRLLRGEFSDDKELSSDEQEEYKELLE
jgi:hypothetical protein